MSPVDCEVLICGLGPVGQLLALLLGRRGISVIAIDEAPHPHDLPRAAVIDDEVLRIFQSAGIRDEILKESQIQEEVTFVPRHGPPLTLLEPDGAIHGQAGLASIHQPTMEKSIVRAASTQETVQLRWDCRLEELHQHESGVSAIVREPGSTETGAIEAKWVIGCDGGGSMVRQLLGIEFGGSTFRQRWLVVDVKLDRPLARVGHPHFFGDPDRPIVCLPMSPGRHRWEWMLHPGEPEEPFLEPDSIRRRLEPWLGGEQASVERAVIYTFHSRTAASWRDRRVLLAGDAAHLMPPFAGQGFSSGARDVANLSWKVDAVLSGAPASLLDSYEAERRPHVQAMSRLAVTLGKFVQTADSRVAGVRDLLLRTLETSGVNRRLRRSVKPVPAYGRGAFATAPARLAPQRVVGAQFPQPLVRTPVGGEIPLDDVSAGSWVLITNAGIDLECTDGTAIENLRLGEDIEDDTGVISGWMKRNKASWVILRPDRFVFALGGDDRDLEAAVNEIHRQLGRAAK